MVDGAGVVRPTERELPRMDPPNVLWFAGAYATSFAAYAVLETLPDSHDSLWPFLASIGLLAAFAAAMQQSAGAADELAADVAENYKLALR